jgi:periplasmic protein TonB
LKPKVVFIIFLRVDAALHGPVGRLDEPELSRVAARTASGGLFGPAVGSIAVHVAIAASLLGARHVAQPTDTPAPTSHMVEFEVARVPEPIAAAEPVLETPKTAPIRVAKAKTVVAPTPSEPKPAAAATPEPPAPSTAAAAPMVDAPLVANAIAEGGSLAVTSGTGTSIGGVATRVLPEAVSGSGSGAPGSLGSGRGMLDHSRAPQLAGSAQWSDCPFPSDAYDAGVESGTVKLQVRINASGGVDAVSVLSDPGYGFGHEARRCAMRKRWQAGLDREGKPIAAVAIVNARFAQR